MCRRSWKTNERGGLRLAPPGAALFLGHGTSAARPRARTLASGLRRCGRTQQPRRPALHTCCPGSWLLCVTSPGPSTPPSPGCWLLGVTYLWAPAHHQATYEPAISMFSGSELVVGVGGCYRTAGPLFLKGAPPVREKSEVVAPAAQPDLPNQDTNPFPRSPIPQPVDSPAPKPFPSSANRSHQIHIAMNYN